MAFCLHGTDERTGAFQFQPFRYSRIRWPDHNLCMWRTNKSSASWDDINQPFRLEPEQGAAYRDTAYVKFVG